MEEPIEEAIDTNLPNIKYLDLCGALIDLKSLLIILEGCKNLEYLDVSGCIGFRPNEMVLELASHIKTFKCEGSMLDEEFDAAIMEDYIDALCGNSDEDLRAHAHRQNRGPGRPNEFSHR
ncbi:unnamed protein product, partial [Dovyalis caffra]